VLKHPTPSKRGLCGIPAYPGHFSLLPAYYEPPDRRRRHPCSPEVCCPWAAGKSSQSTAKSYRIPDTVARAPSPERGGHRKGLSRQLVLLLVRTRGTRMTNDYLAKNAMWVYEQPDHGRTDGAWSGWSPRLRKARMSPFADARLGKISWAPAAPPAPLYSAVKAPLAGQPYCAIIAAIAGVLAWGQADIWWLRRFCVLPAGPFPAHGCGQGKHAGPTALRAGASKYSQTIIGVAGTAAEQIAARDVGVKDARSLKHGPSPPSENSRGRAIFAAGCPACQLL